MGFSNVVAELMGSSQRLQIEQSWLLFFQLLPVGFIFVAILLLIRNLASTRLQVFKFGLIAISALPILNYLGLIITYLAFPDFADPAEANVASVSWLFHAGYPLYPKLDAAERYINNYGSCLYMVQSLALSLLKPSFFSAKFAGCLSGILSLFFSFLIFRKSLTGGVAILGCALTSLWFLGLTSASGLLASSFWVRPDSLLLLCTTVGLVLAVYGNKWSALLGSAIALGISTNLKITALLHFLPIYVLLLQRFGAIYTLISLAGSGIVEIAPFILPNISLANYLSWLQQVGRKGINPDQITKNLLWMGYVSVPIAIVAFQLGCTNIYRFKKWCWHHGQYLLVLIPCIVVTAVMGATRGALENNMLPFVPLLIYLLSDLLRKILHPAPQRSKQSGKNSSSRDSFEGARSSGSTHKKRDTVVASLSVSAALAFVASISLTVYSTESAFISRLANAPGDRAVQDIERVIAAHQGKTTGNAVTKAEIASKGAFQTIGMGYGSRYPLSTYRPVLVFANNPYLLDSASLMEMQASGLNNTPANTLNMIKTCQTQIWLIPKNEKPFEVYSYYPPLQKLFSDAFRTEFKQRYERQEQTEFYDLWVCKPE
jgi:hypothetical protein